MSEPKDNVYPDWVAPEERARYVRARERNELREAFRVKFGYRPMLTYRMCRSGEDYEQALRDAVRTGDTGNIGNADWHGRMSATGLRID
jgi:hypothetical protein